MLRGELAAWYLRDLAPLVGASVTAAALLAWWLGPIPGGAMGVLDIERRSHELLVQSFHLFDETQLVIKTQAIIEVAKTVD